MSYSYDKRTYGELRTNLSEITELDMTPHNADDYLYHEKYHSFLKGCECEMRIVRGIRGDDKENKAVQKYCKTHNVLCSKTGWEIGWFHGTKSKSEIPKPNRPLDDETVLEIREQFKTKSTLELCQEYNLTYSTIYGIISGARYRNLATSNLYEEYKKRRV